MVTSFSISQRILAFSSDKAARVENRLARLAVLGPAKKTASALNFFASVSSLAGSKGLTPFKVLLVLLSDETRLRKCCFENLLEFPVSPTICSASRLNVPGWLHGRAAAQWRTQGQSLRLVQSM